MPDSNLKKELLDCIKNTNDEELHSLMKEDFVFYGKVRDADNPWHLQRCCNEFAARYNSRKIIDSEDLN